MPNLQNNLQNKTVSGFMWRFLERCGAQGVTFIVSIILARILDPDVYGTIALVTVIIALLQVFVSSGMGTALIQKKDADDLDFSTLFFFNVVMCIALYLLMFFASPLIAKFYNLPELTPIIRVLSIILLISGVKNIQHAYVSRHMMFRKFFFSTLGGTIGAAILGITMALLGYGVWALVAQTVFNHFVDAVILWITVKWRPKLMFSFARLKGLFKFGWKLLLSSLINAVYNDVRQLIIGKKYSSEDLAFYNRGKQFPNFFVSNVNSSIDSVLLPTMSKEQDKVQRVKAMTRRAIKTSSYLIAPLMIGLAVCARPLVLILLTEKWLFCVPFLQIFCFTYLFQPIHTANLNAINALGRSDMFLKLEIIKKSIGVASILITMWISVEAMAYSLLITTTLCTVINAFPNKKLLNYGWGEQMKDIFSNIGIAVLMGIPVFFMQYLPLPTIVVLILQILTGVALYVGISISLKIEAFTYLLNFIKTNFMKKKTSTTQVQAEAYVSLQDNVDENTNSQDNADENTNLQDKTEDDVKEEVIEEKIDGQD